MSHIIKAKEHSVRECGARNIVMVEWVPSKEQIADIFTKPLSFALHDKLMKLILNYSK